MTKRESPIRGRLAAQQRRLGELRNHNKRKIIMKNEGASSQTDTFSLLCELAEQINRQEPYSPEPALCMACDCGRWAEATAQLQRPHPREEKQRALYWACYAWEEESLAALHVIRELISQLGGFSPTTQPHLLEMLIFGGVYPLIPQALSAGYTLPPNEWWEREWGDELGWSSVDMRDCQAWRQAIIRLAAQPLTTPRPCKRLPNMPRRLKKKRRSTRREREWFRLLRMCA